MRRIAVVLAGGKGERFWPLSRPERPKQFLRLLGGKSFLQATYERLRPLFPEIWVATTEALAPLVREHLPGLPEQAPLLEPEGRDTASAVALALIKAEGEGVEVLAFFPSDHYIQGEGFAEEVGRGLEAASRGILLFGIRPTYPATGYGYLEEGEEVEGGLFRVARFREKPDREAAQAFLSSGRFYWNSGILIASTSLLREEFLSHAPEVYLPLREQGVSAYRGLPKKSVDYALLEKSDRVYMLKATFLWDDLGDWTALERLFPGENAVVARHLGLDTRGAILYSTGKDLIVTIGVEDLVIVRDGEVTLIARKDRVQDLKKVLEELRLHPELKDAL